MDKVFITIAEAAARLSEAFGKAVDVETIAQAFDFAPFGRPPFPLYARLGDAKAEGVLGFRVMQDVWAVATDGEEVPIYRLICPWPDPSVPESKWAADPQYDDCSIILLDTDEAERKPFENVKLEVSGYFVVCENEAAFLREHRPNFLNILPRPVHRIYPSALPLAIDLNSPDSGHAVFLFRRDDVESYIAANRATPQDNEGEGLPEELRAALAAYRAVRNDPSALSGKTPKQAMLLWLDHNTNLSKDARERAATIANWSKVGGAPRTPTMRKNLPPG